jgi:hypothetical protein
VLGLQGLREVGTDPTESGHTRSGLLLVGSGVSLTVGWKKKRERVSVHSGCRVQSHRTWRWILWGGPN